MAVINLTSQQILGGLQNSQQGQPFYLGANQFTFSIPVLGSTWPGNPYSQINEPASAKYSVLSAQQADAFRQAIAKWDELIQPDFTEVTETPGQFGEIRVAFTQVPDGTAAYAYTSPPRTPGGAPGDVWLDSDDGNASYAQGTQRFAVLVHEIGHTLGLKHPFDAPVIQAPYDNVRYTVLSYTPPGYLVTFTGTQSSIQSLTSPVFAAGPMVLDIAAVQAIYGAETGTRAGDSTYTFAESDSSVRSIYDGGGVDTIDLSTFSRGSIVDLRPGAYSSIGYFAAAAQITYWEAQFPNFSNFIENTFASAPDVYEFDNNLGIAFGTLIENAFGGAAADDIRGNDAANLLRGNGGQDTLEGRAGNDVLEGGNGTDTAIFSGTRADYIVTIEGQGFRLIDQRAGTNDGSDLAVGIELFQFADKTLAAAQLGANSNALPVAAADAATTNENTPVTITVLANDADANGDLLTVSGASDPAHGSVVVNGGGTVTYTPDGDFNGQDTFTYAVSDGQGGSADATVTVTVSPVNDAPVADADGPYATAEDIKLSVSAANGVLAGDSDIDGDPLTAQLVSGTKHGTLTLNADGSFAYTPAANYNGPDSFTYNVLDGSGGVATASVALVVAAVNDAPTVADPLADRSVARSASFSFQLPGSSFTDVDGDPLSYTASLANGNPLPQWLSFDSANRTFSGTASAASPASLDIRVTASDGVLAASDTFSIEFKAVSAAITTLSPGQPFGVLGRANAPSAVFLQGTTASETVNIRDYVVASFSSNFRNSNDTIAVSGAAENFTISFDGGNFVVVSSTADNISLTLPVQTGFGITLKFETAPDVLGDTRLLRLIADDNGDGQSDLFLGAQRIEAGLGETAVPFGAPAAGIWLDSDMSFA